MLRDMRNHLFVYVVARDFGFAPNPFHGFCTLATCMTRIRSSGKIGDWVMGVGGSRLKATGKIIYLMKITETMTFTSYWNDDRFIRKRPLRNGSLAMMVGDNIYHKCKIDGNWVQEDSHHSNQDGSPNIGNLGKDTSSDRVLISSHFFYFGKSAIVWNLADIGYINGIGHRKMNIDEINVSNLIDDIEIQYGSEKNLVSDDPYDFLAASKRVDQITGRIA